MRDTSTTQEARLAEADELARLLPAPPVPDLAEERHSAIRRFLVGEAERPGARFADSTLNRRRLGLALGAGSLGLAAALAVAVFAVGHHGHASTPNIADTVYAPGTEPGMVRVEPGSAAKAAPVLAQIAYRAARQEVPVPRRDQFVYIRSVVAFTGESFQNGKMGPRVLDPLHRREVWSAQEDAVKPVDPSSIKPPELKPYTHGQQLYFVGSLREYGKSTTLYACELEPTYRQIAALPTDPDALLDRIRTLTQGHADTDTAMFTYIGDLLRESLVPPEVSAALYGAAAKIPGVVIVPDAVDAAGRHGFGVAHDSDGERYEWIFDSNTMLYLGEREYLVRDTRGGKAGMLTGSTAVITRAVVDKAGKLPGRQDRTPSAGV